MKNIFDEDAYLTIVNLSLRKHYKTIMRRRKKLGKNEIYYKQNYKVTLGTMYVFGTQYMLSCDYIWIKIFYMYHVNYTRHDRATKKLIIAGLQT